jgi:hypothetical protein
MEERMSEENAAPEQSNDGGNNSGFTPPATQEELNRIVTDRVNRVKAQFGDYNDLKAKAAKFDEIDQQSKSEAEKAAERITAAESARLAAEARADRIEVALEKGLTPSQAKRLVGSTREELEADADELLKDLGDSNKPRSPKPDPNQGRSGNGTASTAEQFAAAIEPHFTR